MYAEKAHRDDFQDGESNNLDVFIKSPILP